MSSNKEKTSEELEKEKRLEYFMSLYNVKDFATFVTRSDVFDLLKQDAFDAIQKWADERPKLFITRV
jgi:hypothetical protein